MGLSWVPDFGKRLVSNLAVERRQRGVIRCAKLSRELILVLFKAVYYILDILRTDLWNKGNKG